MRRIRSLIICRDEGLLFRPLPAVPVQLAQRTFAVENEKSEALGVIFSVSERKELEIQRLWSLAKKFLVVFICKFVRYLSFTRSDWLSWVRTLPMPIVLPKLVESIFVIFLALHYSESVLSLIINHIINHP